MQIFFPNSNAWINFHCKWQIHLEMLNFLSFLLGLPYFNADPNLSRTYLRHSCGGDSKIAWFKLIINLSKIWYRFCIWFPQPSTDGVSGCDRLSWCALSRYARYSLLKKEGLLHDIQFCLLMASNRTTKVVLRLLNFQFIFWHSILIDWCIDLVDIHKYFDIISNASNLFTLRLKVILSVREEIAEIYLKWKKTAELCSHNLFYNNVSYHQERL